MRIVLEPPFSDFWRKGYLRRDKTDGRGRVDLINTEEDRTTVSYARYLVSVKEGRLLEVWEEVDHIDTDCTNDDLSNLQILTTEEHISKTAEENRGLSYVTLICAYCGNDFEREIRQMHKKYPNNRTFCSRSCNGKYYAALRAGCAPETSNLRHR